MTGWRPALIAMLLWAAHFFAAYGGMLLFPDEDWIGALTLGLGAACLAGLAIVYRSAPRNGLTTAAAALAGLGILWQSSVGLF